MGVRKANFFRFVGPGSLIFFVLWRPDRQFFCFVGPGSPIFFVLWSLDRQFFSFSGVQIANRNENGEIKIYTKTKTRYKSPCLYSPLISKIVYPKFWRLKARTATRAKLFMAGREGSTRELLLKLILGALGDSTREPP